MMNKRTFLLFFGILFFFSCEKEEEIDIPCTTFPCGKESTDLQNYNRVAYDPEFRIGRWVNIRKSSNAKDTLIFHTRSIWSNYNKEKQGVFEKKYRFIWLNLEFYDGYNGYPLEKPEWFQTYYNDTTGRLSIYYPGLWQRNHYIKIK